MLSKIFCILHIIPFLVGHHKGAFDVTTLTPYIFKNTIRRYVTSFAFIPAWLQENWQVQPMFYTHVRREWEGG